MREPVRRFAHLLPVLPVTLSVDRADRADTRRPGPHGVHPGV